jgi:predicted nucleic acid-binding protein
VIRVDANILILATNAESDQHAESRDWLDRKLESERAPLRSVLRHLVFVVLVRAKFSCSRRSQCPSVPPVDQVVSLLRGPPWT